MLDDDDYHGICRIFRPELWELVVKFSEMKEGTRLVNVKELRPLLEQLEKSARWKPVSQEDNEHAVKVRHGLHMWSRCRHTASAWP